MLSIISSQVRHYISAALGALVLNDIITGEQAAQVADAVILVGGIAALGAWSYIEKKFFTKKAE